MEYSGTITARVNGCPWRLGLGSLLGISQAHPLAAPPSPTCRPTVVFGRLYRLPANGANSLRLILSG